MHLDKSLARMNDVIEHMNEATEDLKYDQAARMLSFDQESRGILIKDSNE